MTKLYSERDPVEDIKRAYKLFVGNDPSGKISIISLRRIAKEINENLSEDDLQSMIEEFDSNQDGYSILNSRGRGIY